MIGRKDFLQGSIAGVASACGISRDSLNGTVISSASSVEVEPCGESRFNAVNAVLDREAMQRGWAPGPWVLITSTRPKPPSTSSGT